MKKITITLIVLFIAVLAFGQPILRNYDTTNTTPIVFAKQTNSAIGAIALDVTKQPASTTLSNLNLGIGTALTNVQPASANLFLLSTNNAINLTNIPAGKLTGSIPSNTLPANLQLLNTNNALNLTNIQPAGIAGPLFTGIITNISNLSTNTEFFSNGIITNATRIP